MAFGVTMVLALACLGGLTAPGPVPSQAVLKELIEELVNVTQDQKTPLCNGSMVWSFNLPATSMWYCAARDSLTNVSSCSALQKTQKILSGLCQHKASARVSAPSLPPRPQAHKAARPGTLASVPRAGLTVDAGMWTSGFPGPGLQGSRRLPEPQCPHL
ncbi:PREDICTED: interleukin-13 isoform X1 [Chinchilla lanigera]|uniref:interleukin-13 isoform X1 n=1 Tax=Chinchilla lanigera TaxID=34839 RepID=UPI0006977CDE|nr:PREDICTED: interleukin-13 isoform X1 [Chinchilla lanigera]